MKWADWEIFLNQVFIFGWLFEDIHPRPETVQRLSEACLVVRLVSLLTAFSVRAKEAKEEDGSAMNDKGWYKGKTN